MIGAWIQRRYKSQLKTFNIEITLHGYHYLLIFRIVPLLPFFMVNYLAGITHISVWTFIWTTAAGMLPGALVCSFAGQQLGVISSPENIFSTEVIISLSGVKKRRFRQRRPFLHFMADNCQPGFLLLRRHKT